MKFYYSGRRKWRCPIIQYITDNDWDFEDSTQSINFYSAMNQFWVKHNMISNDADQVTTEQRQYAVDNFNNLKNIDTLMYENNYYNSIQDHNNAVSYIDRGKDKTIVTVSGGSWLLQLTRNSIEHQGSWMLDHYTNYNVISIVDDVKRSYRNPVLYDSCLYDGINDELNSPQKIADYIKNLIPDTEYTVIADCKNGHSSCMLAYYLNATRVLITSGTTTCDPDVVLSDGYYAPVGGKYKMSNFFTVPFEVALRNLAFCKDIPEELQSINSIANAMPDTEFTYMYHNNDMGFKLYRDLLDSSLPNLSMSGVNRTPYTYGDHFINLELRKNGFFDLYLS